MEDNLQESVLSFYRVDPRDQTQVVRLGSCLLSPHFLLRQGLMSYGAWLALNSGSLCFYIPSVGIIGVCYHTWPSFLSFGQVINTYTSHAYLYIHIQPCHNTSPAQCMHTHTYTHTHTRTLTLTLYSNDHSLSVLRAPRSPQSSLHMTRCWRGKI